MAQKVYKNQIFEYGFSFNQKDVISFAEASGDKNPLHLDEQYAKNSIFKKRILHGFLGGSVFSKVFGTIYPGEGTIYLKQNMSFLKPMFVDTPYVAQFFVLEIISGKKRALIKTEIKDENQNIIITGEALIQHDLIDY
jgi:3-hydroxybutyryl-CoA dehydratase